MHRLTLPNEQRGREIPLKVIFNNLKKTTFVLKYIIFLKWVRNYSKIQNLLEQNIFIKMTNDSEKVHICVSV